jgi:ABC-type glycerol-3-phosphate transport system substrate-binding protein
MTKGTLGSQGCLRYVAFVISAVLLLMMMCGEIAAAAPKVQVVHLSGSHGVEFHQYLGERKEAFEKLNPNIEVVIEIVAGNYTEKVMLHVASGSQVEVLDSTHSFMVFAGKDMLADLAPYMRADKRSLDRDILPFARQLLEQNGGLLGLPSQVYNVGAIFNQTLFNELGVVDPAALGDGWTWDALRNTAPKLVHTTPDGVTDRYAVYLSTSIQDMGPPVYQAGGTLFDSFLNPQKSLLNTEPARLGLGFWAELYQRGFASPFSAPNFFGKRSGCITLYGVSAYAAQYMRDVGDEFVAVLQPKGPARRGGHTFFGPYQVVSSSVQQQAAYKWIAFLALNEESQAKMMHATGRTPAYPPVLRRLETYTTTDEPHIRRFLLQFRDVSIHGDNFPHTLTAAEADIKRVFDGAFAEVRTGERPFEGFLETVHPLAQLALNQAHGLE